MIRSDLTAFGRNQGEATSLLRKLSSTAPDRFHRSDWAMISLLSGLGDPAFAGEMDSLVEAYRAAGAFHPEISLAIADYYGKTGEQAKGDVFLRQIADRIGYGEENATRDACVGLSTELLRSGKTEEGQKYLWMATLYAKTGGASIESQERLLQSLKF
jgi:hypothetical protein